MTIKELHIGDSDSMSKTITETDVYLFAGFISAVLGMQLPGPGTIYLGQELKFTKPVRFGDTITATCTVAEILEEKNIVKLETICANQDGDVVIKGMATVMPPK